MFGHRTDLRNQITDLQRRLNESEARVSSLLTQLELARQQLLDILRPPTTEVEVSGLLPDEIDAAITAVSSGYPAIQDQLVRFAREELARGTPVKEVAHRIRLGDEEEAVTVTADTLSFIPPEHQAFHVGDEDDTE